MVGYISRCLKIKKEIIKKEVYKMSINKKILAVVLSTVMVAGSVAQVGPCFAAEELNQTQRIEQNQTTPVQIPENKGTWDRTKDAAAKGWDKTKKVAQEYPKLAGAAAGAAAAVGVYAANQVVCKTVVEKRDPKKPFGRVAKVLCKGVIRKRAAATALVSKQQQESAEQVLTEKESEPQQVPQPQPEQKQAAKPQQVSQSQPDSVEPVLTEKESGPQQVSQPQPEQKQAAKPQQEGQIYFKLAQREKRFQQKMEEWFPEGKGIKNKGEQVLTEKVAQPQQEGQGLFTKDEWEKYKGDELKKIRADINSVLFDKDVGSEMNLAKLKLIELEEKTTRTDAEWIETERLLYIAKSYDFIDEQVFVSEVIAGFLSKDSKYQDLIERVNNGAPWSYKNVIENTLKRLLPDNVMLQIENPKKLDFTSLEGAMEAFIEQGAKKNVFNAVVKAVKENQYLDKEKYIGNLDRANNSLDHPLFGLLLFTRLLMRNMNHLRVYAAPVANVTAAVANGGKIVGNLVKLFK